MLFPTIPFVVFFLIVMPLSWILLPLGVDKTNWLHRLPWKIMILIASYIFLGYNQPKIHLGPLSLPLPCVVLATSILFNYCIVALMQRRVSRKLKKTILAIGIVTNVSALGYFKYRNFFIEQTHDLLKNVFTLPSLTSLVIPIAISFFTFQALSYIIDVYRGEVEKSSLLDLAVYLSFFPHLVAGPIVRANEFIPQVRNPHNPRAVEVTQSATLIARGLFKKMVVADLLYTQIVRPAFGSPARLGSFDAIVAIYGYAAQLYCDFSGYTDIAIGLALLLGFRFPENFNRPYTATSLRDFWQRWHMTLSRWLRDYVYIPLGGNRKSIFGARFISFNLIATMVIGGLWHGANVTFLIWGLYHGIGLAVEKVLRKYTQDHDINIPAWIRRILTFHFVTLGWVIFASASWSDTKVMFSRIFADFSAPPAYVSTAIVVLCLTGLFFQYFPKSYSKRITSFISNQNLLTQSFIFGLAFFGLSMLSGTVSAFLYGFF